jgi:hypothetical protein
MSETTRTVDDAAGSVPTEWLRNQAIYYRSEAERNPSEFREYRRMAWACAFVREAWEGSQNRNCRKCSPALLTAAKCAHADICGLLDRLGIARDDESEPATHTLRELTEAIEEADPGWLK